MPVHHQQHPPAEITQPVDAAHADVAVAPVIGDVKAANAVEDVRQRPITLLLDLILRDDADRGRRLGRFLLVLGSAIDSFDLDGGQFLEAERFERGEIIAAPPPASVAQAVTESVASARLAIRVLTEECVFTVFRRGIMVSQGLQLTSGSATAPGNKPVLYQLRNTIN